MDAAGFSGPGPDDRTVAEWNSNSDASGAPGIGPNKLCLGEIIGSGGMGQVYRATEGGREVAVKFLAGAFRVSQVYAARFRREHQTLSRLTHPNIVQVYNISDDNSYFTMELVHGPNMQDWLRGLQQPPSARQIANIVLKIASAVEYANRNGIIHRDLKPRNVLIVWSSNGAGECIPKIIDFGVAAVDGATQLTCTGQAVGSLNYLPPESLDVEQAAGGESTVDVYGIGGLLYFLMCGRAPFDDQASTAHELISALQSDYIVPSLPRTSGRVVDKTLETICLRCLAKSPDDRYASAGEVVGDLLRYLNGVSIVAVRDSARKRLTRLVRRNAKSLAMTTAALACAVTMAALWVDANRGRAEADRTVDNLLGVLDSQASVLASSEILKSPENHALCDALFDGYRISHQTLNLTRLSAEDTLHHAAQLLVIAEVAHQIGNLETATEFAELFSDVHHGVSEESRASQEWSILASSQMLLRAEVLLDAEELDAAFELANATLRQLACFSPEKHTEFCRLEADLLSACARSRYLRYRRGVGLLEVANYCLREVALRRRLLGNSGSDIDRISLAKALGRLGLAIYKSGSISSQMNDFISPTAETSDFEALSQEALGLLASLDQPDSVDALLTRCDIQNTLGMSYVRRDTEKAVGQHRDNLRIFKGLRDRFPLVVDYQLAVARSHGNLADALEFSELHLSAAETGGDLNEALEHRQAAFELYCQTYDEFGLQRDSINDICVHGVKMFYAARVLSDRKDLARVAIDGILRRTSGRVAAIQDVSPIFAATMFAELLSAQGEWGDPAGLDIRGEFRLALKLALSPNLLKQAGYRDRLEKAWCASPALLSLAGDEILSAYKEYGYASPENLLANEGP